MVRPHIIQINSINELNSIAKNLLDKVFREKIILIRGIKNLIKEDFFQFAKKITHNKENKKAFVGWNFGNIMELKEGNNDDNYLFSKEKVPFHWDGAFHDEPRVLLFNCIKASHKGRTLFCDTTNIINSLNEKDLVDLKDVDIEYSTEKKAHYGGKIIIPLVQSHPVTNETILRLGEEVNTTLNPVQRKIKNEKFEGVVRSLDQKLYDKRFCYAHEWQDGDILLADNFALLHGREAFENGNGSRHLRRIQIR